MEVDKAQENSFILIQCLTVITKIVGLLLKITLQPEG